MNENLKIIGRIFMVVILAFTSLLIIPWIIFGVVMLGEHVFGPYWEWIFGTIGGLIK